MQLAGHCDQLGNRSKIGEKEEEGEKHTPESKNMGIKLIIPLLFLSVSCHSEDISNEFGLSIDDHIYHI